MNTVYTNSGIENADEIRVFLQPRYIELARIMRIRSSDPVTLYKKSGS